VKQRTKKVIKKILLILIVFWSICLVVFLLPSKYSLSEYALFDNCVREPRGIDAINPFYVPDDYCMGWTVNKQCHQYKSYCYQDCNAICLGVVFAFQEPGIFDTPINIHRKINFIIQKDVINFDEYD